MAAGVYELTLRAPDGRERRTLAWFPNEQVGRTTFAVPLSEGWR